MRFYLGLDLGQRQDHTALAIVERIDTRRAYQGARYDGLRVRHVERAPLGTSYPRVVERMREIVRHKELAGECTLAVDGTGVGAPVVEMLRAARMGCEVQAITITGGDRVHANARAGVSGWSVPKQDLLAGLQVGLETGELRIARGLAEVGWLVKELLDMRVTMGMRGRLRMGADGGGQHDDLVIALALACWSAKRPKVGMVGRRLV